jgi:hypothetical protein
LAHLKIFDGDKKASQASLCLLYLEQVGAGGGGVTAQIISKGEQRAEYHNELVML